MTFIINKNQSSITGLFIYFLHILDKHKKNKDEVVIANEINSFSSKSSNSCKDLSLDKDYAFIAFFTSLPQLTVIQFADGVDIHPLTIGKVTSCFSKRP